MMLWLALLPLVAAFDETCMLQQKSVNIELVAEIADLPDCSAPAAVESFCQKEVHRGASAKGSTCSFSCGVDGSVLDLVHDTGTQSEHALAPKEGKTGMLQNSWNDEHLILDEYFALPHVNCYMWNGASNSGMESQQGVRGSAISCGHNCYNTPGCMGYVHFDAHGGQCWLLSWITRYPISECEIGQEGTESWQFTVYVRHRGVDSIHVPPPSARDTLDLYFALPHLNCYPSHGGSNDGLEDYQGISGDAMSCASTCFDRERCRGYVHFDAHGGMCWMLSGISDDPVAECEFGQSGEESWQFTTYVK